MADSIDFGAVTHYRDDKGFGFVNYTLNEHITNNVFFHISNISKSFPELAERLKDCRFEDYEEGRHYKSFICFWYRFKNTKKGLQVTSAVSVSDLTNDEHNQITEKMEMIWQDKKYISELVEYASEDILGLARKNKLKNIRQAQVSKEKLKDLNESLRSVEKEKLHREEFGQPASRFDWNYTQIKCEIDDIKRLISHYDGSERKHLELIETEYKQIIEEMKPIGFTHSKELSYYIIENKLGKKYKNISGIVKMEKGGDMWDYEGGFPPNIYKRICIDFGLYNENSEAKVVDFESYQDLQNK